MKKTKFAAMLSLLLACLMVSTCVLSVFAGDVSDRDKTAQIVSDTVKEAIEILGDVKWEEYSLNMTTPNPKTKVLDYTMYSGAPISVNIGSAVYEPGVNVDQSTLSYQFDADANIDGVKCVITPESGTVTWTVTVPEKGLYAISLTYYDLISKSTNIERTLRVNGEVPFNEVRNLLFTKTWADDYKPENFADDGSIIYDIDGNGNERRPAKKQTPEWTTIDIGDPTGYYNGMFFFALEEGENTISLQSQKEPMAISDITVKEYTRQITYAEYKAQIESKYSPAPADAFIKIEAERTSTVSDRTLYPINDVSSAITSPQSATHSVMNAIGGESWQTMGQWIEYEFTVDQPGIYQIDARYIQQKIEGLFVSRRLYIDGVVPFAEANNISFEFDRNWQVTTFSDGETAFEFYFDKGVHTLRLEVCYGNLGKTVSNLRSLLGEINNIYLRILQIAGTEPDANTSYQFYSRIPKDIKRIGEIAKELESVAAEIEELGGGASSNSATIENVARALEKMAKNSEEQIAKQFTALKSHIGNLGTLLNKLGGQSLELDYLVVRSTDNTEKLKAEGNFFQKSWYEIQRFVVSFTSDNSSFASVTEAGEDAVKIEVWTTVSREKTPLIRSLVDEDFAATHSDISVNLKIVAAGTLLPATLAGQGPDVMMDVAQSDAINYAVRGAVLDVSKLDGYDELAAKFHYSSLAPLTVALGSANGPKAVFGIPQTQSFEVMFFRTDVFAQLGITVPTTWDEFYAVLPKLMSKNYQIGMPKSLSFLTTLIYQNGGSLYTNEGTTISFDTDTTLDSFTDLCNFVNLYSCPITYDAANRFRTGEMPVLFADYITFYNQFTVFATELKGLWSFTTIPGTVRNDGTVDYSNVSTISCMVIMKDAATRGTAEAGFEFINWWMQDDIQGEYANELIALLGPAGKYNSANYNAFNAMPWSSSELIVLNELFSHLKGYPEMHGGYIIPRYMLFAFYATYNNGAVPSDALLEYVDAINSELARKREELENGNDTSRSFYIPADSLSQ
ncbi:MAG: extracellular solute-binding protein [Clostridia bacterium]|nr:extracellular solute-binding protein [Clostridia bacterium]